MLTSPALQRFLQIVTVAASSRAQQLCHNQAWLCCASPCPLVHAFFLAPILWCSLSLGGSEIESRVQLSYPTSLTLDTWLSYGLAALTSDGSRVLGLKCGSALRCQIANLTTVLDFTFCLAIFSNFYLATSYFHLFNYLRCSGFLHSPRALPISWYNLPP